MEEATLLCDPVLRSGAVTQMCSGCFRAPGMADVALARGASLELLAAEGPALTCLHMQPLLARILDMHALPACSSEGQVGL